MSEYINKFSAVDKLIRLENEFNAASRMGIRFRNRSC